MIEVWQHTINGLSLGSIYALIAVGYTLVYGILRLINFAHSEVYMMGAFFAYYSARFFELNLTPGWSAVGIVLLIAMTGSALLGVFIERTIYRPLRGAASLNVLIAAIGMSLFLQYFAQLVFGPDPKVFPTLVENHEVELWGWSSGLRVLDLVVFSTTLFILLLLMFVVYRTKTGLAMRAVAQNSSVATLMGVPVNRVIVVTFMIGSALAGAGSVLVGLKYPKIEPLMGMMIGVKAFVAAVLGGIGSLPGAVIGGLLMGLSEEAVVIFLSSTYRDALAFGLLIVLLLVRPQGLLGKKRVEKV